MVVSYNSIYFLGLVSVGKSSITSLEYGDSEKTWWAIVYVCRNILSFASSQIFQNIVKMYFRNISNGRNVWPERKNGGHNKPHCAQETAASTRKGLACVSWPAQPARTARSLPNQGINKGAIIGRDRHQEAWLAQMPRRKPAGHIIITSYYQLLSNLTILHHFGPLLVISKIGKNIYYLVGPRRK